MLLCQCWLVSEGVEDDAGQLSLQAAQRFAATLALGSLAFEVDTRRRVDAALGDRDPMQGAVQLPVTAAVEAVASALARAGLERCDPGVACELGVAREAFNRPDLAEQLGGAEGATAGELEQPWASVCARASSSRSSATISRVEARQRASS